MNKAAEKGHIKSTLILSWSYKEGKRRKRRLFDDLLLDVYLDFGTDSLDCLRKLNFPKNQEKSETLYKKAFSLLTTTSSDKDCEAIYLRAFIYEDGEIFGQSNDEVKANQWKKKAAECYKAKAEAGDYEAMHRIGKMYCWGNGVEGNSAIALKWLLKSAETGNPEAMSYLGHIHEYGICVEKDIEKAIEWYQRTAEIRPGDGREMARLGSIYEEGGEVEQDYDKALEWYMKAANAGNITALDSIGDIYRFGKGVAEDSFKAIEWYERAVKADENRTGVMVKIADTYSTIQGRENDSISWYENAAELGSSEAMLRLCKFCFDKSTGPWLLSEMTDGTMKRLEDHRKKAFYLA